MTRALRLTVLALIAAAAVLFASTTAEALLEKHECGFCHSLHGTGGSSPFVPNGSPTNLEVLCLGCHLTAIDGADADTDVADAVQPHRFLHTDSTPDNLYITCSDCHAIHDNMPNWRVGHSDAPDNDGSPPPTGWVEGTNVKMVGRADPDETTPYAIIITKEIDRDKNGLPDRGAAVTPTCDPAVVNDCYMTGKRHVIFENRWPNPNDSEGFGGSGSILHAFADNNEDGVDDTTAIGVAANASDTPGANASPWDSICQMCHQETQNHTGWVGGPGNNTHNQGKRCTDGCHLHSYCFDKGNNCTKWSAPNRDIQVDLVAASPTTIGPGETTTITVDVTNLGDAVESFEVAYLSSLDGVIGWSEVTDLYPAASTQTSFNWTATTVGVHLVEAEAEILIDETQTANNSGSDTVTVQSVDVHDVAVTSVTAPSPIRQGNTETVSVDIANPGTFTETFDVTLYDNTDDPGHASPIGTQSSGALAPSGTGTLNFSWDTTGASLGSHTLEAVADTVTGETNTANNSATTTSTVAIHDVEVTSVTAPASVDQGTTATVSVDIGNLSVAGGFSETFNVTLYDDTDTVTIGTQSSGLLTPGGTSTLDFSWDTTGASIATHTLRAVADTVPGETITANNTATTTSDVIVPVTHDVAVDSVTAPATVDRGTTVTVDVVVSNNGGAVETFNVTLSSDLDGTIDTLSSGALGIGAATTLNFSWVTDPTTSLGVHTLTAVADTVPGETNTADNTNSTTSEVTSHDVAVDSVTAPASTPQGDIAAVDVDIRNDGSFTETFDVTLTSDLDGTIDTLSSGALGPGATTTLNFSWDTTGATIATHTLTATAATVAGELDTADNSASTTSEVTSPGAVHDLAVTSITFNPASPISTCGSRSSIDVVVRITNEGTAAESNFFVSLSADNPDVGNFPDQQVTTLAAGAFTDQTFNWNFGRNDSCGVMNFTGSVTVVAGETDTADNSLTEPVTIQ